MSQILKANKSSKKKFIKPLNYTPIIIELLQKYKTHTYHISNDSTLGSKR